MPRLLPAISAFLLLLAPLATAQAQDAAADPVETPPEDLAEAQKVPWSPPNAGKDGFTWVQLVSDEWVKGEIKDLRDGNMRFDSDELDEFDYDWADIRAVITSEPHTVTTWDRESFTGFILARPDGIRVLDENGGEVAVLQANEVSSMIQGTPRERNFWAGSVSIGSTVRSGNSDQSDGSTLLNLNRRALVTRWDSSASINYAESNGEKTQESQRYTSKFDRFFTRNLFVTFAEYEYFRDPFQNIRQRQTPGAAFGYDMYLKKIEFDVSAGAAWQYLQYESVEAGADREVDGWVGRFSANADWDITADIELGASYSVNIPFEDSKFYTSNLLSTLSMDLWWNFELDFTFAWDRQNSPQTNVDGVTPEKDDYRLTTGIGWDF
jgi:putative salt-induced outer membrane protein YdiY